MRTNQTSKLRLADELNTIHTAKFPSRGSRKRSWGVLTYQSLRTSTTDGANLHACSAIVE
ncbi:unnamed protein product [Ectocarpus sp. 6 AP-2014]